MVVPFDCDAPPPKRPRRGGAGPLRPGKGRGRGEGKGERPPPLPPPPVPPLPPPFHDDVWIPPVVHPPPPPVEKNKEDDDDIVLPPVPDDPPELRRAPVDPNKWVDGLDGARICYKDYHGYRSYKITCSGSCGKRGCEKVKGAAALEARGPLHVFAFLQAWREVQWPTDPSIKTHRLEDPSDEAVAAWIRNRSEDLASIAAQFA